ncbi:cytochrome d ubiquinol oxidase subunit II [Modestobacter sp. I12A-02628]|uniref:Cytochrome d ubiquinol oxidase subunit II n=1 Tax=Goekera deserti TaxID=2497753 RepID=A0A7K3WL36_9ACTN|nr:cytochrome d ubiquinol oxidase subunit II [Goekera deserti]MPQ96690.1 cytochrome d ubiquinol oxidase subunit II [Goekera deserti]NDI46996.1 cytochrome d ubiquinol oxidase subunit II [Goekera deserti]NEL56233.1 cytochrome d ubiquinol oxidase subunit II [Goekera deserti]
MDLQTVWFVAVAVLWTGFLLLEGFDFGVAALIPVLGRRTADRHLMLRTVGPLWDGNEVWLVTAVGATFGAFPIWYGSWLPALYLPFVGVLVGLIVRAVGFEWRHSSHDERWDRTWTRIITGGSLVACLGLGAALGATTLGLPIGADGVRVGGAFSGLHWPALLGAVAVLAFALVHGALFLALKTDGPLRLRARAFALRWSPVAALPLLLWAGLVQLRQGTTLTGFLWVVAALAVVLTWSQAKLDREGRAFAGWALTLVASMATVFGAAYPVVLPSTIDAAFDLTVSSASVSDYTLTLMSWVAAVGLPVVIGYQAWTYWVFRTRLTAGPQQEDAAAGTGSGAGTGS